MIKRYALLLSALSALMLDATVFDVGEVHRVAVPARIEGRVALSTDGQFVVGQTPGWLHKIELASAKEERLVNGENLYNITISDDGSAVAYNRPSYDDNHLRYVSLEAVNLKAKRVDTIVSLSRHLASGVSLGNKEIKVLDGGRMARKVVGASGVAPVTVNASAKPLVAIDRGHLTVDGIAIDPLGKGSYLWPSLSPDGKKIVYWCVGYGCYVCNLDGSNPIHLGGMRAAVWAGNDAVVGMYDRDNGMEIIESRLVARDINSREEQILTSDDIVALFPAATASRIAFVDLDGNLYYMDITKR